MALEGEAARRRGTGRVARVVVAVLAAAGAGYAVGVHRAPATTTATGVAYVGEHVASVDVDGWYYGVSDGVPWIDRAGTWHEGGWPACLPAVTQTDMTFGWVPVTYPDGATGRQVAYVDCRR